MIEYESQNEVVDKIRIKYGVILHVIKHRIIWDEYISKGVFNKKNTIKIDRNIRLSILEIVENNRIYPVGTYFVEEFPVVLVDKNEYKYELRLVGGCIVGNQDSLLNDLNSVIEQINSYN